MTVHCASIILHPLKFTKHSTGNFTQMHINKTAGTWIFLGSMIILITFSELRRYSIKKRIDIEGVNVPAKITDSTYGRGYNIEFIYYYNNILYTNTANTTMFKCVKGDSILIRILPEKPDGSLEIEHKLYSISK